MDFRVEARTGLLVPASPVETGCDIACGDGMCRCRILCWQTWLESSLRPNQPFAVAPHHSSFSFFDTFVFGFGHCRFRKSSFAYTLFVGPQKLAKPFSMLEFADSSPSCAPGPGAFGRRPGGVRETSGRHPGGVREGSRSCPVGVRVALLKRSTCCFGHLQCYLLRMHLHP